MYKYICIVKVKKFTCIDSVPTRVKVAYQKPQTQGFHSRDGEKAPIVEVNMLFEHRFQNLLIFNWPEFLLHDD